MHGEYGRQVAHRAFTLEMHIWLELVGMGSKTILLLWNSSRLNFSEQMMCTP